MNVRLSDQVSAGVAEIERDAAEDGVGRLTARWVFWLPMVGALVVAATLAHRPLFTGLVKEDGPLEWLQFAGFLAASILLFVATWMAARRRDYVVAVLLLIGALGIFGIAGEEISWGQRIFDLDTPTDLAAANQQHELNIHNITAFPMQRIGNYNQLVLGAAGLLLPWLTRVRRPLITNRILRLLSPPLFISTGFGLLFVYRAIRFLWASSVQFPAVITYGEWPEFTFALGLFTYAFLLVRGLRRGDTVGTAGPIVLRSRRPDDAPTLSPATPRH